MKIAIVEDELLAYERLVKLILEIEPNAIIAPPITSVVDSINYLGNNKVDTLFMDIHLADGISFEIFEHIQVDAPIIFTTAFDQYALDAFKFNSIHYLLKPIKKIELETAWAKLGNYILQNQALQNLIQLPKGVQKFVVKLGNKYITIPIEEAVAFYSKDKASFIYTYKGQSYPLEKSLDKIMEELNDVDFFRANRHIIVHRNCIEQFNMIEKSKIIVNTNLDLPLPANISSERSAQFKQWYKKG